MRCTLVLLLLAAPVVLADEADPKDPKAPVVREIASPGFRPESRGPTPKPIQITTAEALAKTGATKEAQADLLKNVDLKKEYLLVFAWAGSGQDKLTHKVEKGKKGDEVAFALTRGFTRDLRQHVKVFALTKGTAYRMAE